jgi:hypothetical protein
MLATGTPSFNDCKKINADMFFRNRYLHSRYQIEPDFINSNQKFLGNSKIHFSHIVRNEH